MGMEGWRVEMAETSEILCPGKTLFSAKNWTSRFVLNGIMDFRYFYGNSMDFDLSGQKN